MWKRMRNGVKPFCFAQRIENSAGEGVPDVVLHMRDIGTCHFVELKCRILAPKRFSTAIFTGSYGLRPAQIAWIHSRAVSQANVWILGQCSNNIFLIHGRHSRNLADMTYEMLLTEAKWSGSAYKTDWIGMIDSMK